MVFVGYGVTAPERGWDDFKGVDLHGKIAVMLVNDPDFEAAPGEPVAGKFGGKTMTYYGRWTYKYEEAARRGAIGALIVHETRRRGLSLERGEEPGGRELQCRCSAAMRTQPVLLQGWIQRDVAAALLKRAGLDFDTVKRQARTGGVQADRPQGHLLRRHPGHLARINSHNVIGKLTGSNYPNETISRSAATGTPTASGHADAQGKTIRPGAADDALGLAAMLEDARLFAAGPRPQRTLALRGLDRRGARPARLRILRAAPALPDRDDGREPDPRHAAVRRARRATSC